jgi:hypothetical protein
MVNDKRIGKHCNFLNEYVPVYFKYFPNGISVKSCDSSSCGNKDCDLCNIFAGAKSQGQDCLDDKWIKKASTRK